MNCVKTPNKKRARGAKLKTINLVITNIKLPDLENLTTLHKRHFEEKVKEGYLARNLILKNLTAASQC